MEVQHGALELVDQSLDRDGKRRRIGKDGYCLSAVVKTKLHRLCQQALAALPGWLTQPPRLP